MDRASNKNSIEANNAFGIFGVEPSSKRGSRIMSPISSPILK